MNSFFANLKKRRCLILFIIFIGIFCFEPFVFNYPILDEYIVIIWYLLFVLSPAIITLSKKYLIIIIGLLALSVTSYGLYNYSNIKIFFNLVYLIYGSTDVLAILAVLCYFATKKIKTRDDLYASILVFFLIGGTFGDIYYSLEVFNPKSIHFAFLHSGILQVTSLDFGKIVMSYRDFLYFSFCSLTTVGYGDIIPFSATAKRVANIEACIGVLYIAVFIGRIIGSSLSVTDFGKSEKR